MDLLHMNFWHAWLLFGFAFLLNDLVRELGPGSSTFFVARQRGTLVAFLWAIGIILGSAALFVTLLFTPDSVIKRLPNFGPRKTA